RLPRRLGDRLRQHRGAGAAALEAVVDLRGEGATLERELPGPVELLRRVVREGVDRDDGLQPEGARDAEVALEVVRTHVEIAVAVVLEGADGRDEDDRARLQAGAAGDDVE